MRIKDIFLQAIDNEFAKRLQEVKDREPALRGGNAGYLVNGVPHGKCAREAVMRYFGIDKQPNLSLSVMFAAGYKMEEILIDKLKNSGMVTDMRCEEEVPIKWDTTAGLPVTGRPDIVIFEEGKPKLGIECKMTSSIWSVKKKIPWGMFPGKPDAAHIAQAAHYMYMLGQQHGEDYVDWKIVYVNPVHWHNNHKDIKHTTQRSEFMKRDDKGNVFRIDSFVLEYDLSIDQAGTIYYQSEGDATPVPTQVTLRGISDYYEMVAKCIQDKKLPPRYNNADCHGKKPSWNPYSPAYNDYAELHDLYDSGRLTFDQFIAQAKFITS